MYDFILPVAATRVPSRIEFFGVDPNAHRTTPYGQERARVAATWVNGAWARDADADDEVYHYTWAECASRLTESR